MGQFLSRLKLLKARDIYLTDKVDCAHYKQLPWREREWCARIKTVNNYWASCQLHAPVSSAECRVTLSPICQTIPVTNVLLTADPPRPGYVLDKDGYTCNDINECTCGDDSGCGGCEQLCVNTIGSFHCSCKSNYVPLRRDASLCVIPVGWVLKFVIILTRVNLKR